MTFWCALVHWFDALARARAAAHLAAIGLHEEARRLISEESQCCSRG